MKKHFLLLLAGLMAFAPAVVAGELGKAAPALKISEWIKGKPVELAEAKGKQVVVVEFWATWCGPCRTSIPHLTEMQKQFKGDVVFVGVSDEKSDVVKKFVEKMGEKMDYVVALDEDRKTSAAYMEAFGVRGIPHAFVVDKAGNLVWHGHPMAELEDVLKEIIAGKYDVKKAAKRARGMEAAEEFSQLVSQDKDADKQAALAKEIKEIEAEIGALSRGEKFDPEQARKMIRFQVAVQKYQMASARGGDAENLAALEKEMTANAPADFKLEEFKDGVTLSRTFNEYFKAATGRGGSEKLPDLAAKIAATKSKNFELLNSFAWELLTNEQIKTRDYDLAIKLAKAALQVTGNTPQAAPVLDTYARALFDSGKVGEAVAQQKKAVELADDEEMKKELRGTLKNYESKLPAK
jgi:thiol-disulfide isomerase/thioredoxin